MTLTDFVRDCGLTQEQIALELGITQSSVSRLIENNRASPKVALAVERWTEGKVPAEALSAEVALVRQSGRAA